MTLLNPYRFAVNYGYHFNGSGDKVDVPELTFLNKGTLMIRLKLDNATPAAAEQGGLCSLSNNTTQNLYYPFTDGTAYLAQLRSSRVGPITLDGTIDREDWHWFVVRAGVDGTTWTFDQATDGGTMSQRATAANQAFTGLAERVLGQCPLANRFFDGVMDRVLIWDDALSDAQCQSVIASDKDTANASLPLPDNLLLRYEMNEGEGTNAIDSSGNGKDGTITAANEETFHEVLS